MDNNNRKQKQQQQQRRKLIVFGEFDDISSSNTIGRPNTSAPNCSRQKLA